ncbi:MAG: glycosyltransferase family 1 protein [Eubacterium sp.]|nr:glycosyltransferase family 1 protein [Eubacterium sp.]
MIRKIILYNEGIETLIFFSKQLGAAFEHMGYETFYFNQESEFDSLLKLMEFIEPDVTASVGFNFNGCSGEDYLYDKNGVHLYDFRDVLTINIVVDHPMYYHKFEPYLPERYVQLSIDGEHEDYLKRFFPEIKRGPECLLAGTSILKTGVTAAIHDMSGYIISPDDEALKSGHIRSMDEESPYAKLNYDRHLPIVFTGNYNPPEKQDPVLARNGPEYEQFYHDLIDDFIAHPDYELTSTIERHLRDSFADELTEDTLRDTFPYMIVIDLYIRHYFRGEVVRTLVDAGIPVHVYGAGWELLRVKNPDCLITHPNINSKECLERISEADISLNVMPWFKRGAHDRVFNSMLNGAVCVTDPSDFLLKEFNDGEDIFFYKLDELDNLPDIITRIQNDKDQMEKIRRAAYKKCLAHHTWSHRAELIAREFFT